MNPNIWGWVAIQKRPLRHYMKKGKLICGTSLSDNASITLLDSTKGELRCVRCVAARQYHDEVIDALARLEQMET